MFYNIIFIILLFTCILKILLLDNSLLKLLGKCENLKLVDIANCRQISHEVKEKFGKKLFSTSQETGANYILSIYYIFFYNISILEFFLINIIYSLPSVQTGNNNVICCIFQLLNVFSIFRLAIQVCLIFFKINGLY